MKLIIEYDISPSADNPDAKLDPEKVTLRMRRRIQNADVSELWLDYPGPDEKPVKFIAKINHYAAAEPIA
jgi:hypothetical protein